MPEKIEVDISDLEKIYDALTGAKKFHAFRDEMNAALHKSQEVRYSPLTSTLFAERDRLHKILNTRAKEDEDIVG